MAYNPISMDDDGMASFAGGSWPQNGADPDMTPGGHTSTASIAGVPVIDPMMTPGEFIRRCQQQYYFEFSWEVPFPRVPAAPLLYLPEAFKELLNDPLPLGVMQAELDAMSEGVLARIPLAYYLLRPEVVEEARGIAVECEQRVEELQRQATVAGLTERLTWRPEEVNPYLERADAELLDTDIDLNLVLERDKPSLTLLQRPLYTDMGLVSQEQRHLERLARIVPEALRGQPHLSSSQDSQTMGGAWTSSDGVGGVPPHAGEELTQASTRSNGPPATGSPQQWLDGIRNSFRFARTLDTHYEKLLESVAQKKLGLDCKDPATMSLTRRLWQLLFEGTNKAQQRGFWHQLCRFSSNYDARGEVMEQLRRAVIELQMPHSQLWLALLQEYVHLLTAYTANLSGGTEQRKEQLQIGGKELDPFEQGAFQPDLQPGATLQRVAKELGTDRQPVPIFPVEVLPLYPAGFEKAAAEIGAGSPGRMGFLGELATALHHVVLPGAVVSEESRISGPHALVNNTNLLVADKKSARQVSHGLTVSYHTSRENTFEPLVTEESSTSSYLVQLRAAQAGSTPAGLSNANRRHAMYNRLSTRSLFVKAPNAEAPPYERYVLIFGAEGGGRKRPREVHDDAEDPPSPAQLDK
ncbi:uncharacterized protein Tco025E_08318 [Trypanosoma conorhini]|uniref:Uncharacterized protein n=1 Tax=Trypanosoma conorhini TaxID=83891 RepID=A0A3R7N9N1_9TRYP|nr:uncharacterized protein Tco025E_08318 [Trypanosoma conorhini]RNF02819.1 hypothetical protein Tco025E_08318 [Trypanosoma conorhini]